MSKKIRLSIVVLVIKTAPQILSLEKLRPKAQFLAMRLAFARLLASSTTIPESLYEI